MRELIDFEQGVSNPTVVKQNPLRVNIRCTAHILLVVIMTASCSDPSAIDRQNDAVAPEVPRELSRESAVETTERRGELQPSDEKIGEDCAAFVRATKGIPARAANADCPTCSPEGTEVLVFRRITTGAVSCSGDTCNVVVTIYAVFNLGAGETLAGGLTAWIPPQQRSEYLIGQTPAGEQAYGVQITYKRRIGAWEAVEFDRAPVE